MSETTTEQTATSVNYFGPIWARRWLVAVIVIVVTVGAYGYENRKPRTYGASTSLYFGSGSVVSDVLGGAGSSTGQDRTLADLSRLMETSAVYSRAAKIAGARVPLAGVVVAPASSTDFINISSIAGSPQIAAITANSFAQGFIQYRRDTLRQEAITAIAQLQPQLASTKDSVTIASLSGQIAQLQSQARNPSPDVQQIDRAVASGVPLSPNPKKTATFAFVLSLLFAMALAYGLERFDRRLKSKDDLEPTFDLPLLAEIPHVLDASPMIDGAPVVERQQIESFRALRMRLEVAAGTRPLRSILVASAVAGEGKSLVVRNLGLTYADAGLRVAILEADLRRPTMARLLGLEAKPGLVDVFSQADLLARALQPVPGDRPTTPMLTTFGHHDDDLPTISDGGAVQGRLDLLSSGRPTDSLTAAVAAESIKSVLARLTEEYDLVLIDSAPLLVVSDAVPLLEAVDGVVLVARLGKTTENDARRLSELVGEVKPAHLLGVVANDLRRRSMPYYSAEYAAVAS